METTVKITDQTVETKVNPDIRVLEVVQHSAELLIVHADDGSLYENSKGWLEVEGGKKRWWWTGWERI